MDKIDLDLLMKIADLHGIPEGSYNIRKNGQSLSRASDKDVEIVSKKDKDGIDIIVRAGVKAKSVHIPVILTAGAMLDKVYNDFYIGKGADVTIIAGCGIHNDTCGEARHDGVHTFYLEEGSSVKYIERHYGEGNPEGKKEFTPITKVYVKKNAHFYLESTQLGGVTYTDRLTLATIYTNGKFTVREKLLTDGTDKAITRFKVKLVGRDSTVDVVSRSVARGNSYQSFVSNVIGKNRCFGHVECDSILLDNARILSTPKIDAVSPEASLVHEAAVGKINQEETEYLMARGLSEAEAQSLIIKGFLSLDILGLPESLRKDVDKMVEESAGAM